MKFRLYPTPEQEQQLLSHCAHARFMWNLGLEQRNLYRPEMGPTPYLAEQGRQLTEARAGSEWLASGPSMVQQQALRDLEQAFRNWWAGTHGRPTWRRRGQHEGFRVVDKEGREWHQLSRRWGQVRVPKVGWVRFRMTRHPSGAKSYRVKRDPAGRWWICFAVIPEPKAAPGNGSIIGVDRGVKHAFTMSDGEMVDVPRLTPSESARLLRLQRKLARQTKGSARRECTKRQIARVGNREINRKKDVVEKLTTRLATEHDLIRIEDLRTPKMIRSTRGTVENPGTKVAQKRGLNREIRRSGWGLFAERLGDKAPGRVEKVRPAFTSQRCFACGHVAAESRENQSRFCCVACGHRDNADVNAAKNIAAGHAVTARGGTVEVGEPLKREPQLARSG